MFLDFLCCFMVMVFPSFLCSFSASVLLCAFSSLFSCSLRTLFLSSCSLLCCSVLLPSAFVGVSCVNHSDLLLRSNTKYRVLQTHSTDVLFCTMYSTASPPSIRSIHCFSLRLIPLVCRLCILSYMLSYTPPYLPPLFSGSPQSACAGCGTGRVWIAGDQK